MAKKYLDPTEVGRSSYRDLQIANQQGFDDPELTKKYGEKFSKFQYAMWQANPYEAAPQEVQSPLYNSNTKWGESMFDDSEATLNQFQNLGDIRAKNQPWYAKVGAGLAKGVMLAATTFLDGTVGLLAGAGTALKEGRWSGLWDNDFSKAMQAVNEWSEQALPNYYTRAEQEQLGMKISLLLTS